MTKKNAAEMEIEQTNETMPESNEIPLPNTGSIPVPLFPANNERLGPKLCLKNPLARKNS